MGFRQVVVELQGLARGVAFQGIGRVGSDQSIGAEDGVAIGDAGIGLGIIRVGGDGLLKQVEGAANVGFGALVPVIAALQIKLISLGRNLVCGELDLRGRSELHLNAVGHGAGYVAL